MEVNLLSGKKFNSVRWVNLGNIVSRIKRVSGDLELNPELWPKLPAHFRRFFELHEFAHWKLNTRSEELANAYAINHFIRLTSQEQDLKDLNEIKVFIEQNNLNAKNKNLDDSEYSNNPFLVPAIITGATSLFSSIFGSSAAKKQRDLIEKQNELAAEMEREQLEAQLKILEIQAELQDDEQEATQKQTILIGGLIFGIVILMVIAFIIKGLLK